MLDLLRRARRKHDRDGLRSLSKEGLYHIFESRPVRKRICRRLLDQNDVTVIEQDELFSKARSNGRIWNTFTENGLHESVEETVQPIPDKTRIPASRSFADLERTLPTEPAVIEAHGCTLIHPFGLTLCDGGVLQETIAKSTGISSRTEKALSKSIIDHGYREVKALVSGQYSLDESIDVAAPLLMLWRNYYHWSLECLPRLAGVERYHRQMGIEPEIIIPENPSSWMRESLDLLGIDESRRHELNTHYMIGRLVVPTHPGPTPAECQWLRKKMYDGAGIITKNDSDSDNRIYISRRNATRRRVQNEEAVTEMLRSCGFTTYQLEDLSVEDQISLFANAEAVVSPHGAGLTNLIYSESTKVIELFGDSKKTTFHRLANILGHEYRYTTNTTKRGDLIVNLQSLREHLDELDLQDDRIRT